MRRDAKPSIGPRNDSPPPPPHRDSTRDSRPVLVSAGVAATIEGPRVLAIGSSGSTRDQRKICIIAQISARVDRSGSLSIGRANNVCSTVESQRLAERETTASQHRPYVRAGVSRSQVGLRHALESRHSAQCCGFGVVGTTGDPHASSLES